MHPAEVQRVNQRGGVIGHIVDTIRCLNRQMHEKFQHLQRNIRHAQMIQMA